MIPRTPQRTLTTAGCAAAAFTGAVLALVASMSDATPAPVAEPAPSLAQPVAAAASARGETPETALPAGLRLLGVAAWAQGGQRVSRALIGQAHATRWYEAGSTVIEGWTLAEVDAQAAVLRRGDQALTLPLEAPPAADAAALASRLPTRVVLAEPRPPAPLPADPAELPDPGD